MAFILPVSIYSLNQRLVPRNGIRNLFCKIFFKKVKVGLSQVNSDGQLNLDSDLACFIF